MRNKHRAVGVKKPRGFPLGLAGRYRLAVFIDVFLDAVLSCFRAVF